MERIPAEVYDEEYFLSFTCEGIEEFMSEHGLSPLKRRQVRYLAPTAGSRVLDLGCGRGEVLLACARAGAEVCGIDYSEAAIGISRRTLAGVGGAEVVRGDVTNLPWPDDHFDAVLSGDVIEHLVPEDAAAMLREARRVLRREGRFVVHTSPNRLFLRIAWPLSRLPLRLLGHDATVRRLDAWINASKRYHTHEQTLYSLRRHLRRAGFKRVRVWVDAEVVREGRHHVTEQLDDSRPMRAALRIAGSRPLRILGSNDIWAVATK